MAILVDVFEGVCLCVSTLWDLQEMRFANVFDGQAGHGLSCFTFDRFVCTVAASTRLVHCKYNISNHHT
ncbi:hypothetical protein OIU84_025261 [Salix udensis]|uniref:Uncharacterized protein n=1 Tax=Salix udensis TaxID=889485 RepID=A0AAD6PDE2_9ROSI|nr:hypothetical protein OIU84_025261 [Salix udensis]